MVRGNNQREVHAFVEDQASPYYLHPSDNPGIQLVTQQLNGSNYNNWNRSMVTALLAKNKLAFMDGSLPRPHDADPMLPIWIRCNSMVTSWLRNSVIQQISSSLMYMDEASKIWSDLKLRFAQGDIARIYQLRQRIMSLTQGHLDVSSYYTELRILWDEYKDFQPASWCSCGACRCNSAKKWNEFQEQDCAMQFLIGLNPSFAQLRSQLLSSTPLASLSKIFSLAVQEERQRNIDGGLPPSPSSLSQMTSEQPSPLVNAAAGYGRGKFLCTHCGKTNHTVDKCFQLHGFPPGFARGRGKPPLRNDSNSKSVNLVEESVGGEVEQGGGSSSSPSLSPEQCQQLIAFLQNQLVSSNITPPKNTTPSAFSGNIFIPSLIGSTVASPSLWLIDTGATHHICCNLSWFTSPTKITSTHVNLPNGDMVDATHIGNVHLSSTLCLSSVLFVPQFTYNLFVCQLLNFHIQVCCQFYQCFL